MQPMAALRAALLAALMTLGGACEGVGPFSTQDAFQDPPGFDDPSADDSSTEMSGRVSSVDTQAKSFRIVGSVKVQLDGSTDLESDDECGCNDLGDIEKLLQAGLEIRAEIRGKFEGGVLFASRVRFEVVGTVEEDDEPDDDEGDEGQKEIKGIVASVDLLARSCRTTDGKVIEIKSDSIIDLAGDLHALADVALSLTLGVRIRVEAKGKPTAAGLIASSAKFVVDP